MLWYVLFVTTGKEDVVGKYISNFCNHLSLQCFIPKKVVPECHKGVRRDVIRVLFPGYIFIRTTMSSNLYYLLKEIPNLHYIVNSGDRKKDKSCGFYSAIPEEEMEWIRDLTGNRDTIEYSEVSIINKKVKVISGPLKGKEAMIKKVDKRKRRAKIEVTLLNKTNLVDVGINILSVT
ncbi:antiterminator LoaP [Paenibacillus larvae]